MAKRNVASPEFKHLQKGISNFTNFTIKKFNLEEAIIAAAKTAYLAEAIKNKSITFVKPYINPEQIGDWLIEIPQHNKLNKLKKNNPEAFYYWYQSLYQSN